VACFGPWDGQSNHGTRLTKTLSRSNVNHQILNQKSPPRRLRVSYSIRSILLVTTILAIATAYLWPYYDDSRFVNHFHGGLDGQPARLAIDIAKKHRRRIAVNQNDNGGLLGLNIYAKDRHLITLGLKPIHANLRPESGWKIHSMREMTIQSVNIYDLRAMEQFYANRFRF